MAGSLVAYGKDTYLQTALVLCLQKIIEVKHLFEEVDTYNFARSPWMAFSASVQTGLRDNRNGAWALMTGRVTIHSRLVVLRIQAPEALAMM
jgi:hypothetical protein